LESLRFNNKFEYNIRVEDDVDATVLKVPPLIIQPYVENAIWHGLMHKRDKGNLDIEVSRTGETLICKVIDNGVGRTAAEEMKRESRPRHKSMGIEMTESRIAMSETNGGGRSVEIKDLVYPDGSPAGTEVVLKIPAIIN